MCHPHPPSWTGSSGREGSSHLEDEGGTARPGRQEMIRPSETASERVRDERKEGLVELRWSLAGAGLGKGCRLRGPGGVMSLNLEGTLSLS